VVHRELEGYGAPVLDEIEKIQNPARVREALLGGSENRQLEGTLATSRASRDG